MKIIYLTRWLWDKEKPQWKEEITKWSKSNVEMSIERERDTNRVTIFETKESFFSFFFSYCISAQLFLILDVNYVNIKLWISSNNEAFN